MNALAIDTSTAALSVALQAGEDYLEATRIAGLKHAERLVPLIHAFLEEAGIAALDVVICARGPGSFTGLRIGMATAKGLAAGYGCGFVAVPTLDALAYGLEYFPGIVVPVIDGKKHRYYAAVYRNGSRISDYVDAAPSTLWELTRNEGAVMLTGPDAAKLRDGDAAWREAVVDRRHRCGRAFSFLRLGLERFASGVSDSLEIGPLYLRKSEAEVAKRPE